MPPRDKDVDLAPQLKLRLPLSASATIITHSSIKRPLGKRPFIFELGRYTDGVGRMEHNVPEQIVSPCAVSAAAADQSVVTGTLPDPSAAGTLDILLGKGNAKPTAKHANKKTWVIVERGCF